MTKRLRFKNRFKQEGGYGKPPLDSQFQPGQSGNPKGRPKGSLNVVTVLEKALREKVAITEGGRRKVITKLDAAVKQVVNKAAQGDPKAIQLLLNLTKEGGGRSKALPEPVDVVVNADRQVMESLIQRIRQYRPRDTDESNSN
jgi:hypothetical protein